MIHQMHIFGKTDKKARVWEEVEKALDAIEDRFGKNSVKRGRILK